MGNDYRDELGAAVSRIDALERENAALKNAQSGRAATAAELEAVRLESALLRLDLRWEADVKNVYGGVEPTTKKSSSLVAALVGAVMAGFGIFMAATSGHTVLPIVVYGAAGLVAFAVIRLASARRRNGALAHRQEREAIVAKIAKLRGAPEAAPRVRIAAEEEAVTLEGSGEGEAEAEGQVEKRR